MKALALRLYSLLMWLAQPLLRSKLARRARKEPGYSEAVEERFGRYSQAAEVSSELVWLHAVSLGETRTAALLLKALRAQHPGLRLLLTHGTATGRAEGAGLLQPGDVQVWQPWDSRAAVVRFFDHFKPRLGLLMETEIWPNLVAVASARAVPLLLVNGRLSDKSLQQALRMAPLSLPAYGALAAAYAQTEADAERFHQLGAPVAGVFGNLKFDASPNAAQLAQGQAWRQALAQPVLMFASSREGEEDEFLKQIKVVVQEQRALPAMNSGANEPANSFKALIVPRHPQRFDEVAALAEQHGLRVSRRSQWTSGPRDNDEARQADVWLGDSLGEMALYYALSDVALLGGSFAPLGGQNLIEAAACGCPIVMGPHTFNFTEAAELAEAAGAAQRVAGLPEAVQAALLMVDDPQAQASAAAAGLAFAARNQGATAQTLNAVQPYLQSGAEIRDHGP
jgi:3-deoxy-D-manno-octulosonic-acid transferase